jgi:hypothetical protein
MKNISEQLEIERRYCVSETLWEDLLFKLGCLRVNYQKDITWMVENSPSRMIIERLRLNLGQPPIFMRKNIAKVGVDSQTTSLESVRSVPDVNEEIRSLDSRYPRDLEISKFRAETSIGPVIICLDYLPVLESYFVEVEVNSPDFATELDATVEALGLSEAETCRGYGYYISNDIVPEPSL